MVALLLYVPSLPAPRRLVRGLMHLARAAFPIYLLHRLVPEVLMPIWGLDGTGAGADALAVGGGLALGLLAAYGQAQLWPKILRVLQGRPGLPGGLQASGSESPGR